MVLASGILLEKGLNPHSFEGSFSLFLGARSISFLRKAHFALLCPTRPECPSVPLSLYPLHSTTSAKYFRIGKLSHLKNNIEKGKKHSHISSASLSYHMAPVFLSLDQLLFSLFSCHPSSPASWFPALISFHVPRHLLMLFLSTGILFLQDLP